MRKAKDIDAVVSGRGQATVPTRCAWVVECAR